MLMAFISNIYKSISTNDYQNVDFFVKYGNNWIAIVIQAFKIMFSACLNIIEILYYLIYRRTNEDLNKDFDATGHSWARPIRNFVKIENICLIKDLKYDPTYRDLSENS